MRKLIKHLICLVRRHNYRLVGFRTLSDGRPWGICRRCGKHVVWEHGSPDIRT